MSRPETPLEALYTNEEKALMEDMEISAARVPRGAALGAYYAARWEELYGTEGVFRSKVRPHGGQSRCLCARAGAL